MKVAKQPFCGQKRYSQVIRCWFTTLYDPSKPLVLSVDAGPHGIRAVLSHRLGDRSEKPIEYASRTLSMAERNSVQIKKEGLAIVFGIKRFNLYLYGRKFALFTDHQPLTRIFLS